MIKKTLLAFGFLCFLLNLSAQDLSTDSTQNNITELTFSTVRIINGQSIETTPHGKLLFLISHHFGNINQGVNEFFGLDQSTIRFGFEYGFSERFAMGIGRSSFNKSIDGFLKYKFLRQEKGSHIMPISLTYYGNIAIDSRKQVILDFEDIYGSRLQSVHQLLIARKFSDNFSLQLSPTIIFRDMNNDDDNVYAVGVGARYKFSYRASLNAEYFYLFPGSTADKYYNSFSIGLSIKAGGHAFQVYLSNSVGMIEELFIPQTAGSWNNGEIHFGFNISRAFILKETKSYKDELYW